MTPQTETINGQLRLKPISTQSSEPETDLWFGTKGPPDAEIVLIGEAWGFDELQAKKPFVGASGQELDRMLREAGLDPAAILFTNVVPDRPQGNEMWRFFNAGTGKESTAVRGLNPAENVCNGLARLHSQILAHPRKLLICAGNYSLWAVSSHCGTHKLTGTGRMVPDGITWLRGSMVFADALPATASATPVLPIFHPALILRDWSQRFITVHDLKARTPMALAGDWVPTYARVILAPPSFDQAIEHLSRWAEMTTSLRLACDIETVKQTFISCIGFAESTSFAMTIPFVRKDHGTNHTLTSYWSPQQEIQITKLIQKVLKNPHISFEGQNFLYDIQYLYSFFLTVPRCDFDTMLAFHLCFPGTEKRLDYLSSLFCRYHRYWKEDGKEWTTTGSLVDHLRYNAEDCLRTYEIATNLRPLLTTFELEEQWAWTLRKRDLALRMMLRGVKIDYQLREKVRRELQTAIDSISARLASIIPQEWAGPPGKKAGSKEPVYWWDSPKQRKEVFSSNLGIAIPKHRKTKRESLGKEAMNELRAKYPLWSKLFSLLTDLGSAKVFMSHFVKAQLEPGNRMRCSFNPAGTETFRWSSSKNAFGRGSNLQNIPKGDEDK